MVTENELEGGDEISSPFGERENRGDRKSKSIEALVLFVPESLGRAIAKGVKEN
jgi:hypothetical protein